MLIFWDHLARKKPNHLSAYNTIESVLELLNDQLLEKTCTGLQY